MNHLVSFLDCLVGTIQVVTVILFTVPLLLLPIAPILVLTLWMAQRFFSVSRELKRLESVSKSPVFVLFAETIQGLYDVSLYAMRRIF